MKPHLHSYPTLRHDACLDFETSRVLFGRGVCDYDVRDYKLTTGQSVVYVAQQRESDLSVFEKGQFIGKMCEQGLVVWGYLTRRLLRKKVIEIPQAEREKVKQELLENIILLGDKKPAYIEFKY